MISLAPSILQPPLLVDAAPQILPCRECVAFPTCGGHELPLLQEFGCTRNYSGLNDIDPDDMNPFFEERFWELWNDVDGLLDFKIQKLIGADSALLPRYLPVVQHEGNRSRPPSADIVAIPLFQILRMRRDGSYGPRFETAAAVRERFHLRPETKIILRGVDDDRKLERFWKYHRTNDVGAALAKLGLLGVTSPNFSFFTDATRFQILRNRKRILLVCERLAAAGVPVIPHLNALSASDWEFWAGFLREHSEITVVAKEFQTGLRNGEEGASAYKEIIRLQEKVGRPLHPILVAGGRFYNEANKDFTRATVMDSTAFMGAVARQVLTPKGDRYRWTKQPTAVGEPIDDHFDRNIEGRKWNLSATANEEPFHLPAPDAEGQMFLDVAI